MPLTTQYIRLQLLGVSLGDDGDDNDVFIIKDFPDIDISGNPDQIEITTLSDEFHEYIDGLKNHADDLEFTTNYNSTIYGKVNQIEEYNPTNTYVEGEVVRHEGKLYSCTTTISTPEAWNSSHWFMVKANLLLCSGKTDYTGANGCFQIAGIDLHVRLSGGGVGDVLEMVYVIKPKGEITFSAI